MCPSTVVPKTCEPTTNTHGQKHFFLNKTQRGKFTRRSRRGHRRRRRHPRVCVCVCFRVRGRVRVFACGACAVTRRRRLGPRMSFVFKVTFVFVPVVVFVIVVVMGVAVAAVIARIVMSSVLVLLATKYVKRRPNSCGKSYGPTHGPTPSFVNN